MVKLASDGLRLNASKSESLLVHSVSLRTGACMGALKERTPFDRGFLGEGARGSIGLSALGAAYPGQTNRYTPGTVRAESGHCATIH